MKFVHEIKDAKPELEGFALDSFSFPLVVDKDRSIIFRESGIKGIINGFRKRLGTAAEAIQYFIGFEAGLEFTVKLNKKAYFIGKEALKSKNRIKKKQLTNFVLEKSTPGNPLLLHDEPIYYKNKIVGETTSSNYSFCYNKNMVFGYIDSEIDLKKLNGSNFEVEVAKNKYVMSVQFNPLHDPENNFTKI